MLRRSDFFTAPTLSSTDATTPCAFVPTYNPPPPTQYPTPQFRQTRHSLMHFETIATPALATRTTMYHATEERRQKNLSQLERRRSSREISGTKNPPVDPRGLSPPAGLRAGATAAAPTKTVAMGRPPALLTMALMFLAILSCAGVSSAHYFYGELF